MQTVSAVTKTFFQDQDKDHVFQDQDHVVEEQDQNKDLDFSFKTKTFYLTPGNTLSQK